MTFLGVASGYDFAAGMGSRVSVHRLSGHYKSTSADTVDPVAGHAVCFQINGRAEDVGIVSRVILPGAPHDFLIVLRAGDDLDERLDVFLVLDPFRVGKGLAVILIAEGNFFSFFPGSHLDLSTHKNKASATSGSRRQV